MHQKGDPDLRLEVWTGKFDGFAVQGELTMVCPGTLRECFVWQVIGFEILENPSRVLPRQRAVISYLEDNRYRPILKVIQILDPISKFLCDLI